MARGKTKEMDFRSMSLKDLDAKISGLKEEVRKMRFDKALGTASQTNAISEVKRQIARILTVTNEKKLEANNE